MPLINRTLSLSSRFTIVTLIIVVILVLAVTILVKDLIVIEKKVTENITNIFSTVTKNSKITERIYQLSSRTQSLERVYLYNDNLLAQENLLIDDQLQKVKLLSEDSEFLLQMDYFVKSFHQFLGNSLALGNILQDHKKIDHGLMKNIETLNVYFSSYYSETLSIKKNSDDFITSLFKVSKIREKYGDANRLSIFISNRITPKTEKVLLVKLEKELKLLRKHLSSLDIYDESILTVVESSIVSVDSYLLVIKKMQVNLSQRWDLLDNLLISQASLIDYIAITEEQAKNNSLDKVEQLTSRITLLRNLIIGISIFIILFGAMIFSMIVRRHINNPMNNVIEGIENFEAGKLQRGIKLNRQDEWHTIEKAFNKMASRLDETYNQLVSERRSFDYMAHHDPLTGLANRLFAYETINNMIDGYHLKNGQFSLVYLDLDEFKQVNDSLGHDVGDELLLKIANKLHSIIGLSGYAVRLGGDEFMLLITERNAHADTIDYAQQVVDELKNPIELSAHSIVVGCSIGICHFPDHGNDVDTLVRNADTAMYQAKASEGEKICIYKEHMTQVAIDLMHKITGIRQAIEKNEFFLVYQPQFNLNTHAITGVEALLRWRHPDFGVLSADEFLPVAERSGLSVDVDQWVFDTVLTQVKQWQNMFLLANDLKVSINFSGKKFADPGLLDRLNKTLSSTQCLASSIEIEITEQDLMVHMDHCIDVMKKLKKIGFSLAIDDFGTGYSSFGYLKNLPVDTLKIDKIFIDDIKPDNKELAIVKTMLSLGSMLDLSVVAEGIETKVQKKLLQSNGCLYGQGYFLEMPISLEEFTELLRKADSALNK